jgi:hypothetical protein
MEKEMRKIQGLVGEHSFTVVFPKRYANDMGIMKGDWVSITKQDGAIIIRKERT